MVVASELAMAGLVLLLVLCAGVVGAERKMTIAEKLREDADLSQVSFQTLLAQYFKTNGCFYCFPLHCTFMVIS